VVTDDAGAFAFTSLPPDRYSIKVTKGGYLPLVYGSKRPGGAGTSIAVSAGGRARVAMTLIRGGVLSGTVRDESGRPMPNVLVSALRYAFSSQSGHLELDTVSMGSSGYMPSGYSGESFPGTAVTDDQGAYRIWGLMAGQYIIEAQVRLPNLGPIATTAVHQIDATDLQRAQQLLRTSGIAPVGAASTGTPAGSASRVDYAPVYYPGVVASADATPVSLAQSAERLGLDVTVRLTPSVRITGTVVGRDGFPLDRVPVALYDFSASRNVRITQTDDDGIFVIQGVNPGKYEVRSYKYADGLTGWVDVAIEGHDISTSITVEPGSRVSGRIVFDGQTPAPSFSTVTPILRRDPFMNGSPRFDLQPDGQFVYSSAAPGIYKLYVNGPPPPGWMLRSVMINGVDVSDIPFEITRGKDVDGVVLTLTDRRTEINGKLQDASGQPAPDYVLIVYSTDARFRVPGARRTRQVRPDINGTFIARDLPAGDYFISAVTDIDDGQWNDPEFLAALAATSPVRITLAEGEKKTQNIQIAK
jgi:protocatechuate 3,4-dioxygenase beta subunit